MEANLILEVSGAACRHTPDRLPTVRMAKRACAMQGPTGMPLWQMPVPLLRPTRWVLSVMATAFLTMLGAIAARAAPIQSFQLTDAELDFHQPDLTYSGASQADSTYGLMTANLQQVIAAGGSLTRGFVNIHNAALPGKSGSVVLNVPVDPSSSYAGISAMFDLNGTFPVVTSLIASCSL